MSSLKDMYRTVLKDTFPDTMTITLGDAVLTYKKRTWHIDGETKGLRYGENPDQPAALYEMESGKLVIDGVEWRGPQGIMSALTEAQMLQAGKHPGKTNLTDVDNGCNILQYLAERPAAVILKHNNPCGAAWDDGGVAAALDKAFWCDRIAAFGGAVVVNRPFTREAAEMVAASYFEVVAAPAYEEGAVEILKGRKVAKGVRCIVIPATQQIWLDAMHEGLFDIFVEAGAVVSTPTCGPCLGGHMGILAAGERAVSTTNRNFVGRMGHVDSEVYLANPYVAAASAVAGYIVDPATLD